MGVPPHNRQIIALARSTLIYYYQGPDEEKIKAILDRTGYSLDESMEDLPRTGRGLLLEMAVRWVLGVVLKRKKEWETDMNFRSFVERFPRTCMRTS